MVRRCIEPAGRSASRSSSSRRCARRSATTSRSASTSTPASICPTRVQLCREVEPFRPFFVEDPLRSENPDSFKTLRPHTTVPLAAGEHFSSQVGVPPADRGGVDRLRADRPLHLRRLHRGAQDRRLVRDPLHRAGDPQPARAGLLGGLPAAQPGDAELRRAGAAAPHRAPLLPTWSRCSRSGRTATCCPPTAPGLGDRVRPRGGEALPLPSRRIADAPPRGRQLHQLVNPKPWRAAGRISFVTRPRRAPARSPHPPLLRPITPAARACPQVTGGHGSIRSGVLSACEDG